MNDKFQELIPLFVAGQLNTDETAAVERHLKDCPGCLADLNFWLTISDSITSENFTIQAPKGLVDQAFLRIHEPPAFQRMVLRAFGLLQAQAYLVHSEMWPASAAIMALGVIMVLISKETGILTFLAPLVAAASLATIYGPQNDPASELTMATPTSQWKILLARLTLVSAYNLILALAASVALLGFIAVEMLGTLILAWLGPLTLLSALALLLSIWIGTSNAVTVSYGLWIIQYFRPPNLMEAWPVLQRWDSFLAGYRQFWQTPGLLLLLAFTAVCIALISTMDTNRLFTRSSV